MSSFMSCGGTRRCKTTIQHFTSSRQLARLRDLLPVIFESNGIYTLEQQATILRECSLTPVVSNHMMSFCLQEGLSSLHPFPTRSPPSSPTGLLSTSSVSERSWLSSEETDQD